MNEIAFALVDKWRGSILVSGSGKEDFFKHACASVQVAHSQHKVLPRY